MSIDKLHSPDQQLDEINQCLSPFGQVIWADGIGKKRTAIIIRAKHGSDPQYFADYPQEITKYLQHQDRVCFAAEALLAKYALSDRLRIIPEPHTTFSPEIEATLTATAHVDNRRRGGDLWPISRVIDKLHSRDPAAPACMSFLEGMQRLVAQCVVRNQKHLILPGMPMAHPRCDAGLNAFLRTVSVMPNDTALREEIARWQSSFDQDHRVRHEFIQKQCDSYPHPQGIFVIMIGGDHTKKRNVGIADKSVSRNPLEDYLTDYRVIIFEPNFYGDSLPEKPGLLALHPFVTPMADVKRAIHFVLNQRQKQ
jgi:hypothetical protein